MSYEENGEEYQDVFNTEEECTNQKSEYESTDGYIVGNCESPNTFYNLTLYQRGFSLEYTTEAECAQNDFVSEESGFICKKSHQAGDQIYWRIIGLVNTPEGQRVKLVRDESIGDYSWDISDMDINDGVGVNEWSDSDIMKLLNPGYETSLLGKGSLYWNRTSGQCAVSEYGSGEPGWVDCSFSSNGMDDSLKNMIEEITWNTGSTGNIDEFYAIKVNEFYNLERSSNIGKICDGSGLFGTMCNDTIERTTSWKGKVGLIYPSDYGYATSGGTEMSRTSCFETSIFEDWYDTHCSANDWLNFKYLNSFAFTISSAPTDRANTVFAIESMLASYDSNFRGAIMPSVYLKPNVIVSQGDGSPENPYTLIA